MTTRDTVTDFADTLAQVRRGGTPTLKDDGSKRVRCVDCGRPFTRGRNQRHTRCPTCSRTRQVESGRQIRAKSGPFYERSILGKIRSGVREAERLGLDWRKGLDLPGT